VAVEVWEGNTADPKTLPAQVTKLRQRFGLKHVLVVGDRGMITTARLREDFRETELKLDYGPALDLHQKAGGRGGVAVLAV
jgi:hypothetical protein